MLKVLNNAVLYFIGCLNTIRKIGKEVKILKDKLSKMLENPRFVPMMFVSVMVVGVAIVIATFIFINKSEDVPNGHILPNNSNIEGDSSIASSNVQNAQAEVAKKADDLIKNGEVILKNEENPLENPLASEDFKITEDEWEHLKRTVDGLVLSYSFNEANELLNNRVVGLDLDKLEFGKDIQETHMDINGLAFIQTTYGSNLAGKDVGAAYTPLISQNTPERALIGALWISMNAKIEVILNENSLLPITEDKPIIQSVKPLEDIHDLRVIENTYKGSKAILIDFTLESYPLKAIVLQKPDETHQVWKIYQDIEGKAPYQNKSFWRTYLEHISPAGSVTNEGSGYGSSHSQEDYIDDNDDADYQKYLEENDLIE